MDWGAPTEKNENEKKKLGFPIEEEEQVENFSLREVGGEKKGKKW